MLIMVMMMVMTMAMMIMAGVVVVGYCHFIWKESSCCGNLGFSLFTSKLVEMMMMTAGKNIFNVEI